MIFVFFYRSRIEKINYRQKEKQVLDSILGKGYDKRIRPSGKNDTGKKENYRVLPSFVSSKGHMGLEGWISLQKIHLYPK